VRQTIDAVVEEIPNARKIVEDYRKTHQLEMNMSESETEM
jgi:hypothetical protein